MLEYSTVLLCSFAFFKRALTKPACFRQRSRVLHFATAHIKLQTNFKIPGKGGTILHNHPTAKLTHALRKEPILCISISIRNTEHLLTLTLSPYSCLSLLHRSRPTVVTTHPTVLRQSYVSSAGVNVQLCRVQVKNGWSYILTWTWLYGVCNKRTASIS